MALTNITPEQRQEYIRLAAEARERAIGCPGATRLSDTLSANNFAVSFS